MKLSDFTEEHLKAFEIMGRTPEQVLAQIEDRVNAILNEYIRQAKEKLVKEKTVTELEISFIERKI